MMQTQRKRKRRSGLRGADNADELMFRLTASSAGRESQQGPWAGSEIWGSRDQPKTHSPILHALHSPHWKSPSITNRKGRWAGPGAQTTPCTNCLGCLSTREKRCPCMYGLIQHFPGNSAEKNPPATVCHCRRPEFNAWVRKIPWRREWQPTPVLLPGKSHGQRSLVGYSPWGCRVRHGLATKEQQQTMHVWGKQTGLIVLFFF